MDELSHYFLSLQATSSFHVLSQNTGNPRLLVLDIDGTLVGESNVPFQFPFRPGLLGFLTLVQKLGYHLAIWSAAHSTHVETICSRLNQLCSKIQFRFVWDGSKCDVAYDPANMHKKRRGFYFVKPLTKIWKEFPEYNVSNTFILDNTPHTYSLNPDNAIPIPTFNHTVDPDDHAFQKIILYLMVHHPLDSLVKEKKK
jgi:hypothetical protein